ncbi:MAG: ADP-ribosylglycohydrolase family protein [Tissierellia bacterium]|nr:ADP-ribosylglycohydrolase family protein [Tissierellia bacterium]
MLGAIIGDIVGSVYEFDNLRSKDFEMFSENSFVTDDSIMTIAVAKSIMEAYGKLSLTDENLEEFAQILSEKAIENLQSIGQNYPHCGYGGRFYNWIFSNNPNPYNSYGNGAAMRISPVGFFANSIEQVKLLSKAVTEISHNHPEGIKGAEATAIMIYAAKKGKDKAELERLAKKYYDLDFTIDEIRPTYRFNETCQETVPQAIKAFLESEDFEDAIRTAISVGGDSDTLAAITGSIAEAYYGVPEVFEKIAIGYFDERLEEIYFDWKDFIYNM